MSHMQDQPNSTPRTVLVIDDEDGVRLVATRMLERSGYMVRACGDGQAGVDWFSAHSAQIWCVLLDLSMPGLSGEATVQALRAIRPEVLIVLMSGQGLPDMQQRFGHLQPDALIEKPFTLAALRATFAGLG